MTNSATKSKQDKLLDAMNDPQMVDLLYDLWAIVRQTPTRAAEILVQFKDVAGSAKGMVVELQDTIARFDALRQRLPDLRETADVLRGVNQDLAATDDRALNRLNRIIDAAHKIQELKATGTLEFLKQL